MHVELLPVANWLPQPQRFAVHVTRKAPGVPEATLIAAPTHLDVPALADKACKLSITPFPATPITATVTFTNEASGEFLYYVLECTVQEPASHGTLELQAPVRTTVEKSIAVVNPLQREVSVTGTCSNSLVRFPTPVALAPGTTTRIPVRFMPLVASEARAELTYTCAELGRHAFALSLGGQPTAADKTLSFKVALGRAETRSATFVHYHPASTTYTVRLPPEAAADGFLVPATVAAAAAPEGGVSMELAVTFQPTGVCEHLRHTVTLSSPDGGDYECVLVGRCSPPTPQGPVRVTAGKAASVPFLNPFKTDAAFTFSCDNPAFAIKPGETIKAQASAAIAVAFKEVPDRPKTAMLTVACPSKTPCQWAFYLEA